MTLWLERPHSALLRFASRCYDRLRLPAIWSMTMVPEFGQDGRIIVRLRHVCIF